MEMFKFYGCNNLLPRFSESRTIYTNESNDWKLRVVGMTGHLFLPHSVYVC